MSRDSDRVMACGRYMQLVERNGYEFADRINVSGVVVMAAVTDDNELVLTEQYREPHACRVIEMPAGLAGDLAGLEDEALEAAARRELLEETGYEAAEMRFLVAGPPSSGSTSEIVTVYLARGLRRVHAGGGDDSEDIQVHLAPLAGADQWLQAKAREGVLIDPKVYAGLYWAEAAKQDSG